MLSMRLLYSDLSSVRGWNNPIEKDDKIFTTWSEREGTREPNPMDLILLRGMLRYLPQGCRSRRSDDGSEEIPNNRIRLDWNFKEDLSFEEL